MLSFLTEFVTHDLCRGNFEIIFEKCIFAAASCTVFRTRFNDEAISFDDDGLIAFLDNIERAIIGLSQSMKKYCQLCQSSQ